MLRDRRWPRGDYELSNELHSGGWYGGQEELSVFNRAQLNSLFCCLTQAYDQHIRWHAPGIYMGHTALDYDDW
jgi:hypothetical protein